MRTLGLSADRRLVAAPNDSITTKTMKIEKDRSIMMSVGCFVLQQAQNRTFERHVFV
jgi:hypothetical protein